MKKCHVKPLFGLGFLMIARAFMRNTRGLVKYKLCHGQMNYLKYLMTERTIGWPVRAKMVA